MTPAAKQDPLAPLLVFDRLEVGRRAARARAASRAPTRWCAPEGTEAVDLSYSCEEDVFDPADPADVNLAAMIPAQVALNYGLFCREIVFHGPFDEQDRRFLADMAQNTAREIYVNKFLEPNPVPDRRGGRSCPLNVRRTTCGPSWSSPTPARRARSTAAWGDGRGACACSPAAARTAC